MFKVNNKDIRMTQWRHWRHFSVLVIVNIEYILLFLKYSSNVSIVNFELVNKAWVYFIPILFSVSNVATSLNTLATLVSLMVPDLTSI